MADGVMKVAETEGLLKAVNELLKLFPDWRMGQLVVNLVMAASGKDAGAIWDMKDEQLLAAAKSKIIAVASRRTLSISRKPAAIVE